jgi:SprT protein
MPLSLDQQQDIRDRTAARIAEAARLYGRAFAPIPVHFDLRGRAAGQFRFRCQGRQRVYAIRYNPWVFAVDLNHHQADTVAHEVAHYVVHLLHPGAKPHGREWRALMRHFGATPRACTPYDLTGVPLRQQRRHPYRCGCADLVHPLSTTRHRRILQGTRYLCRQCQAPLRQA